MLALVQHAAGLNDQLSLPFQPNKAAEVQVWGI